MYFLLTQQNFDHSRLGIFMTSRDNVTLLLLSAASIKAYEPLQNMYCNTHTWTHTHTHTYTLTCWFTMASTYVPFYIPKNKQIMEYLFCLTAIAPKRKFTQRPGRRMNDHNKKTRNGSRNNSEESYLKCLYYNQVSLLPSNHPHFSHNNKDHPWGIY